jgi:DNA-binding transcriptional MerR regulator
VQEQEKPRRIPIGEAARALGISPEALRDWERRGWIKCWRGPNGRRFFDLAEIERVMRGDSGRRP